MQIRATGVRRTILISWCPMLESRENFHKQLHTKWSYFAKRRSINIIEQESYIFPANNTLARVAVDVTHCVLACCHHSVLLRPNWDIYPAIDWSKLPNSVVLTYMSNKFTTNSWKNGTTTANPGFNLFHAHSNNKVCGCGNSSHIHSYAHPHKKNKKNKEKKTTGNKKNSDVFAVDVVEGAITQSWKDRPSHAGSGMTTHNPPPRHQQKERHQKVLLQSLDWNTVARNCDDVPTAPYFHHSKSRIHKLGCHMYT